ncbi:MAG: hypothetical protein U0525_01275 [Patescibacteria group bacterium]
MDFSKGLPKYELLFIVFLIFCAVVMVVFYDGYQKRTTKAFEEVVDIPPVVANTIDIQVFNRLQEMEE